MELLLAVLAGGGIGAVVLFAWAKWLRKAYARDAERRREDVRQAENSLTERLGASAKDPKEARTN
jgi:hypothetical protein